MLTSTTIMESPEDTCWMNPQSYYYSYSPSGSEDSGVGSSPAHSPDGLEMFFHSGISQESNPDSIASSQLPCYDAVYDPKECIQTGQLTAEELDQLSGMSDTCSLSPASVDHQFNQCDNIEEIGSLHVVATSLYQNSCARPSDNTQKRRRRQKERDLDLHKAHPHVPACLVPKCGTSKPRQSRKRRKSPSSESMTAGQGINMNGKNCYLGARVKKTAKERLEELRRNKSQGDSQQVEVVQHTSVTSRHSVQDIGPLPKRRCTNVEEERVIISDNTYRTSAIPQQAVPVSYSHTVQQILQPVTQRYAPDELEMCIDELLSRCNPMPLRNYAQHHTCLGYPDGLEESPLRCILKKLNAKKDLYCPENMGKITEILCESFSKYINAQNFDGETAIYEAALHGNEGVVFALMKFEANPWIQENKGGQSALHAAVRSKRIGVVSAILDYQKEEPSRWPSGINCASNDGNTPLHVATALTGLDSDMKKAIICKLLQYGADTTKKNNIHKMPHSFLGNDPELKELQNDMKRQSQRKKHTSSPVVSTMPTQSYCHEMYPTSYHHHEQMMAPQYVHQTSNIHQPYGCTRLQYETPRFSSMAPQNSTMPQYESHPTTVPSGYYEHRNVQPMTAYANPENDFDNLLPTFLH